MSSCRWKHAYCLRRITLVLRLEIGRQLEPDTSLHRLMLYLSIERLRSYNTAVAFCYQDLRA